jgi:hypothetical protein
MAGRRAIGDVTRQSLRAGTESRRAGAGTGTRGFGNRKPARQPHHTHDEAFYYYFLGFRCCAESDAKPTDPRTPYQIKKNWKLERVERSAGITLVDLKKRLDDKAKGRCTCPPGDILCNTICGTLLAPSGK